MPKKSTLVIALFLGILLVVGNAEAAERGSSTRTLSIRSVAATETQAQSTGSFGLSKILRLRFLRTLQLLTDLEEKQPEPRVFGTSGLSDGPDPIDGAGQAGSGPPPPVEQQKPDGHQEGGTTSNDGDTSLGLG